MNSAFHLINSLDPAVVRYLVTPTMDGLSGVASGIAVISLSLQLVQSIDQIKTKIRHVRGAPAEVGRLTRVLDLLRALLDDVRQMMEYQTSRVGDAIPMPSMTIFDCLKGCEEQIEPLVQIVRDYEQRETDSASKLAKLRRNVKVGFRASDITGFEDRIQREVNRLNMALTLNNTRQYAEIFCALFTLSTDLTHIGCMPSIYSCITKQIVPEKTCVLSQARNWSKRLNNYSALL
jgi:hypothetical protein